MDRTSLLDTIIKAWNSDTDLQRTPLAKFIVQQESIAGAMEMLNGDLRSLENVFKVDKEKIHAKMKEVQGKCIHAARTYHPDPSGNSDSYYECNICGKEL